VDEKANLLCCTKHWHTSCHQTHNFTSYYIYMHFILGCGKIKIHKFLNSFTPTYQDKLKGISCLSILTLKKIIRTPLSRICMFVNAHIWYHWLSSFHCYIQLYYLFLYIFELICQQWINTLTPCNSIDLESC
jgi:hypothetical protein